MRIYPGNYGVLLTNPLIKRLEDIHYRAVIKYR